LKCILGKQKAGVNLAKKHKGMKQYECNKKWMRESGLNNWENNNIFSMRLQGNLMITPKNKSPNSLKHNYNKDKKCNLF
jgi:hypothetical protein